jgi:predicted ArsR family transcriptional regulator
VTSTQSATNGDGRVPAGRTAVADALRRSPGPATVQDLAVQLRLHPNTVRFHLLRLVRAGLAVEERGAPAGPGRPRLTYRLVDPSPQDGSVDEYRMLAEILAGYLAENLQDPEAAARAAGRKWGRRMVNAGTAGGRPPDPATVVRVVARMLDDMGFHPEHAGDGRILLHRCPFRTAAEHNPGVVCSVHLGLIQGAMNELGADGQEATLDPFVTPRLCVAYLPPRTRAADR